MVNQDKKLLKRKKRHVRVRCKIIGTQQKPRLSVYRSHKNIFAQLVDDLSNRTILFLSTQDKELKQKGGSGGNVKAAEMLGVDFAKKSLAKGIVQVAFDKGAYPYHGSIKAFAESARKGGLVF